MPLDTKTIAEAVGKVKEQSKKTEFNQSIELIINLRDIDMKKPEAKIQETIELPHPPSKQAKVCVIATGELALKAKKAGADHILGPADLEALATDKKRQKQLARDYDIFIAEAPLMPLIGKTLGATLGPRDKMPKPVPPAADVKSQMEKLQKTITLRLRGQPVLQCKIGMEDMKDDEIAENILAVTRRLEGKLKRGLKNITTICLKTTMGKVVRIRP